MPAGYQNIFQRVVSCSYNNRDIPACGCKINTYIYIVILNNINVDAIFGVAKNKNVDKNRPCINSLYSLYIEYSNTNYCFRLTYRL